MPTTDALIHWLQSLEMLLPAVAITVGIIAAIIAVAILTLNLMDIWRLARQRAVFIELTPPAQTDRTAAATQRLFSVLHGMEGSRSTVDKLLRRRVVFSVEIVGTREQGIRYVFRVPENDAGSFEQTIASYLPETKYRRIDDYLPEQLRSDKLRVVSFRQTGHFAYPLQTQEILEDHDPVGYLNGTMTQLQPGELIVFQLVVSPVRSKDALIIQNRLAHNEALVTQLGRRSAPGGVILRAINAILFGIIDLIGDIFHGPSRSYNPQLNAAIRRQETASMVKPARTLSAIEQELADAVNHKLERPLFAVDIKAMVVMGSLAHSKQRAQGIRNALDAFKLPKYQSLKARLDLPFRLRSRYHLTQFRHRLPSIFTRQSSLLSDAELAGVYHFPHSMTAKTENVVKSLSKQLPAPLSLKNGTQFDVVIGRNQYHGVSTEIGLTAAERERHVYIIGGTGNGKTTMMEYAIVQDIRNGKGVAVVDPHGDLAEKLLGYIPEDRIKDVIYFNPADLKFPIGLNLLELPEGLEGDELLDARDFITEAIISIMRKIFSDDDSGGHRIEYILRNTVQTALTIKDSTLFTVFDLLTDAKYRRKIQKNLTDQKLKNFWVGEFGKAGDMQKVKMAAGVTAKIGRFQFSASAERILSQPKSTINFEEILDGKILICNLAKGLVGEDTSELFGISILAKLQLAAYRRVKLRQENRKPFFIYVDEFQNFATVSFVQLLSEARKYKVFLTMAEQSTSQQEEQRMVNTIFANVGTIICFRSGNPADEAMVLPLFSPYVEPGELANLPTYNFYARLSATRSQEPVSGETIVLRDKGSETIAEQVIEASRANYATKHVATETVEPKITKSRKAKKNHEAEEKVALPGDL